MESLETILKVDHLRTIWSRMAKQFQRRFSNIFHIGSYVKTMSADVGGLGWWTESSDIILKGDHIRTILSRFGPNWPNSFRRRKFLKIVLLNFIFCTHGDNLCWWVGSFDTILKGDHQRTIPSSLIQICLVVSEQKIKM